MTGQCIAGRQMVERASKTLTRDAVLQYVHMLLSRSRPIHPLPHLAQRAPSRALLLLLALKSRLACDTRVWQTCQRLRLGGRDTLPFWGVVCKKVGKTRPQQLAETRVGRGVTGVACMSINVIDAGVACMTMMIHAQPLPHARSTANTRRRLGHVD